MILDISKKIQEKKDIDELKECLEYFKSFKLLLSEMNELTDIMIEDIMTVTNAQGDIDIFQLACICKAQEEFTGIAKDILKVFNELGIVKYIE